MHRRGKFSWNVKGFEKELVLEHTLDQAWEFAQNAFKNNEYVDVHCWVFTEVSFLELLKTFVNLDLFDFKIAQFFKKTGYEFFVSLEAIDSSLSLNECKRIQLDSINVVKKN